MTSILLIPRVLGSIRWIQICTFSIRLKYFFIDIILNLKVIRPKTFCRKQKILGHVSLDIGTVWSQDDHQFYHKWAVIASDDASGGPKGYLKVDIMMQTKGEAPKIPMIRVEDTDNIEGYDL